MEIREHARLLAQAHDACRDDLFCSPRTALPRSTGLDLVTARRAPQRYQHPANNPFSTRSRRPSAPGMIGLVATHRWLDDLPKLVHASDLRCPSDLQSCRNLVKTRAPDLETEGPRHRRAQIFRE